MQKNIILFMMLLCSILHTQAQVTYTSSDFASVSDSFHVSQAVTGIQGFDFSQTGANYTWSYDSLPYDSQRDIVWVDPAGAGYQGTWCLTNLIIFGCATQFNNLTNQATNSLDSIALGGFALRNVVNHYKKDANTFEYRMLGGTVGVGGVPIPLTVEYIDPDSIYQFPLTYNQRDSSNSHYEIDLTGLGVNLRYVARARRVNEVEGWGSLSTPYDTFANVLKVRTTITRNDTIYLGANTIVIDDTTVSYKWLDPNYGAPVLEANGLITGLGEVITQVTYIDSLRCIDPTPFFGYLPVAANYDYANAESDTISFLNLSGNADSSYWDFGDGTNSSLRNPSHNYACPGTYSVKLKVFNQICSPVVASDSITLPIVVIDSLNRYRTRDTVSICKGSTYFAGGALQSTSGIYFDTLTALNGCDSIHITQLEVQILADSGIVQTGNMLMSFDTASGYQWLDCSAGYAPIAGATTALLNAPPQGAYAVQLSSNGCLDTSACFNYSYAISPYRGNMYTLDGSNDFMQINRPLLPDEDTAANWTVECWVKTSSTAQRALFSQFGLFNPDRFYIGIKNGQLLYWKNSSGGDVALSDSLVNDGEWHHIAVVKRGANTGELELYVDGRPNGTGTDPNAMAGNNAEIGRVNNIPSRNFPGSIDELRVWNRALSLSELRQQMHLTLQGEEPSLLAYYQFNNDLVVNAPDGVLDAFDASAATTVNLDPGAYDSSEVAIAAGTADLLTVNSAGLVNFANTNVSIDFGASPNGTIVVSRLSAERPTGAASLAGEVDDEYFVIWNYGSNANVPVNSMVFDQITSIAPTSVASDFELYQRGSRAFGATWGSSVTTASNLVGAPSGTLTFSGSPLTNGFSQFVVVDSANNTVLPIENLLYFEAERLNNQEVALEWQLDRMNDWVTVELERQDEGQVQVKSIHQQVVEEGFVQHVDANVSTVNSYYRLKLQNAQGQVNYSAWKAVGPAGPLPVLSVFPNPYTDHLNISVENLEDPRVALRIYNALGEQCHVQSLNISTTGFTTVNLPASMPFGVYYLEIVTNDNVALRAKIIKVE